MSSKNIDGYTIQNSQTHGFWPTKTLANSVFEGSSGSNDKLTLKPDLENGVIAEEDTTSPQKDDEVIEGEDDEVPEENS